MSIALPNHEVELLLVEDNDADIELTHLAFAEEGYSCAISVTHDGAEALEHLSRRAAEVNMPMPALILLDLNMPRMNGKQFLYALKENTRFQSIPVMLLTSSQDERDIRECYHLHAHGYLVKPSSAKERSTMVRHVAEFLDGYQVM